ncbi:Two component regulator propeller [Mucilaginibacter gossypiicola]|uniref:histidine kinase n=1 Tax=Mucilaginibacter gossypiicola TaxID=551995 RepID=A0A1H8LQU8_9SPHI|nr:two-component regulator propeller domain-containing protein [Mucilaginibacter gossypiicola]SEO07542.1 Two component regulator propeller [Mucilaginibacter gossypiicola]
MKYSILPILFILLIGNPLKISAQQFSYLGIERGLSNNTISAIHKDKFGFMWFGTLDGLNRFDGYNFQVFRNRLGDTSSLSNDIITTVNSDRTGNIWVGTQKGLNILDNKALTFSAAYYRSGIGKNIVIDRWITDIKSDRKGNIYVGATDIGCLLFRHGSRQAVPIPLINQKKKTLNYTVTAIDASDDKQVWITVDFVGLCYFEPILNAFISVNNSFQQPTSVQSDHVGGIWIGTTGGLYHYQVREAELHKFAIKDPGLSNAKITSVILDRNNVLWATTDGEGILKINAAGEYSLLKKRDGSGALSSDAVNTIFEDEQSRKWIGTLRGGIDIIDNKKNQFRTYSNIPYKANSLVSNFTFSFCEDKDKNVWIGTDGGGISIWKRKLNTFENFSFKPGETGSLNDNYVTSIVCDSRQEIYVATFRQGVSKYNASVRKFTPVPFRTQSRSTSVWKLYKDHKNQLWATALRGNHNGYDKNRLFKYDEITHTFIPAPFPVNADMISITDDDPDHLWLGSFTGLVHASKITGIDKVINLNTAVRALYKARSGKLWIGTYGKGLMCYNAFNNTFLNYTEVEGLSNNKVLNIEEDTKGDIWVSTYNGISKLNPQTGKFENFYAADGLQSNQFYFNASAHLSTGELMFGGIKGFNIFYPDSVVQYHDFPPVFISGLRISNATIDAKSEFVPGSQDFYTIDKLKLPYDKAIISVDYVALEYSLPEKIQYAYFLQGRDKSWNYVNYQRSVNYSHLNEGRYLLKIKSTNASGIWNNRERMIEIIVLPPWYRTWWAYLIYAVLLIASIYAYLYYHKNQTQLKYEVKFVKEINEKKIAFFTNISHELRTPLTLIVNPIKELLHSNGANLDLVDISAVYRNSRRLLSLVDQLLLFRSSENEISAFQPQVINLKEVCYEVFLCFTNQIKSKSINYKFDCQEDMISAYADRDKLEIILFNIISNAIKYTPEHGNVSLTIKINNSNIEISVTDSGCGIPKETGSKLFEKFYRLQQQSDQVKESGFGIGLYLAKKYVELHQGDLSYTSEIGNGTTFMVHLPKPDKDLILKEQQLTCDRRNENPLLKELILETTESSAFSEQKADKHVVEILDSIVNKKPVILLIDDDTDMRKYVRSLLKDAYIVYEANNTEKGFEIVLESEPDIIVCDVIMHGTTGVEFCSKMKESPTFSHIPIILLTGSSSPEIKLKGIECGADDYITKPFENDLLIARIKSMLKGRDTIKNYFFNEITLRNNSLKIPAEYSEFLSKCIAVVESHLDDEGFSLKTLTDEMGMSRSKLFRKIKSISGLSSTEFIRHIRLRKGAELMIQTEMQIKEIAYKIGFQDIKYFREQFNRLFEMNPSEFIRKYRKTYIHNDNLNSSLNYQRAKN